MDINFVSEISQAMKILLIPNPQNEPLTAKRRKAAVA